MNRGQLLGLVLLLVGGFMLWGPVVLVLAGVVLLAGPELARVDWSLFVRGARAWWRALGDAWATGAGVHR